MMIALLIVFQIVSVCSELVKQCSVDLFFVDWERSKGKLSSKTSDSQDLAPVSIWRSIFMTNEWSDLQVIHKLIRPIEDVGLNSLLSES